MAHQTHTPLHTPRFNKPKELLVCLFNANGALRQKHLITHFLHSRNIDILILTETHFTHSSTFSIPNYITHREDRLSPCGGTAILIKRSLSHTPNPSHTLLSTEASTITVHTNYGPLIIGAVYKRPINNLNTTDIITLAAGSKALLFGDWNSKHYSWGCRVDNASGKTLHNFITNNHNYNIFAPSEPTHFHQQRGDILDICVGHNYTDPITCHAVQDLDSDHLPVIFNILSHNIKPSFFTTREQDHNWNKYCDSLLAATLTNPTLDATPAITKLTDNIQHALHASLFKRPKTNYTSTLPPHICAIIRQRNRCRKLYRQTGYPPYKKEAEDLRTRLRMEIAAHRNSTLEIKLTELADDGDIYRAPRLLGCSRKEIPTLTQDGRTFVSSTPDKAELIADVFQAAFTPNNIPPYTFTPVPDRPVDDELTFTEAEVASVLKAIKKRKAPGPDRIPGFAFHHLPDSYISHITDIFNTITKTSTFPSCWKIANIVPVPKPGKPSTAPTSYRPISLLSGLSKAYEALILQIIDRHIDDNQIFDNGQFGFRKFHSTTDAILQVVDTIKGGYNKRHITSALLLDLSNAFDKVNHPILLDKLSLTGLDQRICRLIASYLDGRTFQVRLGAHLSSSRPVSSGVPQGSRLAPTLFNIFVNKISVPSDRRVRIQQYADDTIILASSLSPQISTKLLQSQANIVINNFRKIGLENNPTKSQYITFTRRHITPPKLTLQNTILKHCPTATYLGVVLDRRLNFSSHIDKIIKNGYKRIFTLLPFQRKLPSKLKTLLYKIYTRPVITYAAPAWTPALSTTNRRVLERFQTKHLKITHGFSRSAKPEVARNLIGISSLSEHLWALCRAYMCRMCVHPNESMSALAIEDLGAQKHLLTSQILMYHS